MSMDLGWWERIWGEMVACLQSVNIKGIIGGVGLIVK